ncbi:cell division protein FtsQ [Agromyces seonyuensis]|uniref:Cell division protein FtsQ n=1 Tax=Agromyces seonyuensis TaxID=2662446 RepID=A0A6I4NSD7_9MICO|nr:cell division protein FtsQ [Agromyces seonyuensis]MWB97163.1 cell division protein FtsQ [Agromyces seonyuensis]
MSDTTTPTTSTTPTGSPRLRPVREPNTLTTPQKLMVLVLSMTLFGLSDLVAEVIPSFEVGPFEFEIAYFAFIPVVLAALFSPIWVAIGAPLGAIIFAELMLGDFSGLGEVEGYLQALVGIAVAGCLVRDPRNKAQLFWASIVFVAIDKVSSGLIDLVKVGVGIDPDTLEESDGLFQAVLVSETIELVLALVVTGILFGALPAMWLAPRLYGKIEPLLGMRPRDPQHPPRLIGTNGAPWWILAVVGLLVAVATGVLSQWEEFLGVEEGVTAFGAFEPDYIEEYGQSYVWVAIIVAVVALAVVVTVVAIASKRRKAKTAAIEARS